MKGVTNISISSGKAQAQTTKLLNLFEGSSGYTDDILVDAFYLRNKCNNAESSLASLFNEKEMSEPYSILDKELGNEVKHFEVKTKDLLGRDLRVLKTLLLN